MILIVMILSVLVVSFTCHYTVPDERVAERVSKIRDALTAGYQCTQLHYHHNRGLGEGKQLPGLVSTHET